MGREDKEIVNMDVKDELVEEKVNEYEDMCFSVSKLRQIAKCDDSFEGASAAFMNAAVIATELFVQYFVEKAAMVAQSENRKKVTKEDLYCVVQENENMFFLEDVFN